LLEMTAAKSAELKYTEYTFHPAEHVHA